MERLTLKQFFKLHKEWESRHIEEYSNLTTIELFNDGTGYVNDSGGERLFTFDELDELQEYLLK